MQYVAADMQNIAGTLDFVDEALAPWYNRITERQTIAEQNEKTSAREMISNLVPAIQNDENKQH